MTITPAGMKMFLTKVVFDEEEQVYFGVFVIDEDTSIVLTEETSQKLATEIDYVAACAEYDAAMSRSFPGMPQSLVEALIESHRRHRGPAEWPKEFQLLEGYDRTTHEPGLRVVINGKSLGSMLVEDARGLSRLIVRTVYMAWFDTLSYETAQQTGEMSAENAKKFVGMIGYGEDEEA